MKASPRDARSDSRSVWLVPVLLLWGGLDGQDLDPVFAVALAAVVTLPIALIATRPAFAPVAPDLLWRADQHVAARHETLGASPAE